MHVVCPTATSPATAAESKVSAILPKQKALSDLTGFESKIKQACVYMYVHVTYCIMENWHERKHSQFSYFADLSWQIFSFHMNRIKTVVCKYS